MEETAPDHSYFFGKFSPIFPSWIWIGAYFEENNDRNACMLIRQIEPFSVLTQ
jgi:hypothetical protein